MKRKLIARIIGISLLVCSAPLFAAPQDGDLVTTDKGTVYAIRDGKRRGIPTPEILKANGYKPEKIITITEAEMNAIPLGAILAMPYKTPKNGDLVTTGKGAVYAIRDGKRCGIPTPEILKANGYKPEKKLTITEEEMNAIPLGAVLVMP